MKINTNDFTWGSNSACSSNHYKSFTLNGIEYNIDDHVLIRNDDSIDPEDIQNCYVAQIADLWDSGSSDEPYQAKVKWFSRISDLPKHCQTILDTLNENEVVLDNRKNWSNVIDAETIFSKCLIEFISVKDEPSEIEDENELPVFFCRYKLMSNMLKALDAGYIENKSCVTPSRKKKKSTNYCAISTGSPQFPRVLIKKIDSRILESENVRILVAKPDAKCVEDVTKHLDDLILSSPLRSSPRKHPHIHTLSSSDVRNKTDCSTNNTQINSECSSSKICDISLYLANQRSLSKHNSCTPKKSATVRNETPTRIRSLRSSSIKQTGSSRNNTPTRTKNEQCNTPNKDIFAKNNTPKKDTCSKNNTPIKAESLKKSILKRENIAEDMDCSSPRKNVKTPRRCLEFSVNNESSVTRSGRKVKTITYNENSSEDEAKKLVISSVKKKMSKFIRTVYSDDSGSAYSMSASSSESEDLEPDNIVDEKCKSQSKKVKRASRSKKKVLDRKSIIPVRKTPLKGPTNILEESRLRLHVSAVPKSLPCREEEFSDIYSFVKGCLCSQTGGCMYISGVPGTGKTATVHEVVRKLEEEKEEGELPLFSFVEVNGMWMTDPYQCYVHIFRSLTGKTIASQQAANLLEKRFTEPGPKKDAVILLVDELDLLWTRKQTVMYNIFDWPSKKHSKLIVLAIANTMDLPERLMMNRISSRLGLTRKKFQPYNFKQLQQIISSRIEELNVFDSDAIQFVSRKVAAVSGDARRALDICRHATEIAEFSKSSPKKKNKILVGMEHVDIAIQQMFSSPMIAAIRCSSQMEKWFLESILADFKRTGSEETVLLKVSQHFDAFCRFNGTEPPPDRTVLSICGHLMNNRIILVDNMRNGIYMKIRLNASPDDVEFALNGKHP